MKSCRPTARPKPTGESQLPSFNHLACPRLGANVSPHPIRMDYHDLIPELRAWEDHNKHPFDPADWIGCVGTFEHAIGYAWLFWPSFVIHEDCILGEGFSEEA